MRIGLVLALLGACSSPPSMSCRPGELRTCSCPSGSTSSQVCMAGSFGSCLCESDGGPPAPDGGVELDAGVDASVVRYDGGPPRDGGTDPACSLVDQTGCRSGQACKRSCASGAWPCDGPPECGNSGPYFDWGWSQPMPWQCIDMMLTDLCQAGTFCLTSGVCARFCDPAVGCPNDTAGAPQDCVLPGPDSTCGPHDACCVPH